jgi:uncharacterized protein
MHRQTEGIINIGAIMEHASIYIFYHKNCQDGFGAAWTAHKKFGTGAHYISRYWEDTEKITVPNGSDVYFLDVALPRDAILELQEHGNKIIILDHHKTAQDRLQNLPFARFDMGKSGAKMAWEYFFPDQIPPRLLDYIEDRDLWRFNLPNSQAINAALESYPMSFEVWDGLSIEKLLEDGIAILRLRNTQVNTMCEQAYFIEMAQHCIPIVNATVLFSEAASALCAKFSDAPFAAYYFVRHDGEIHVGLRSRGDFDVSVVAAKFGGGGHKNAAGFALPLAAINHLMPTESQKNGNEKEKYFARS